MKFLVVGCGAIGKRHIENLLKLGYKDVVAYDISKQLLKEIKKQFKIETSNNFKENIKKVDAALICTPNHLHTKFAVAALKEGKHVFIEKPISHKLQEINEIKKLSNKKKLVVQVGCNLRFHPIVMETKKLLEKKEIGKIYKAMLECGSYLPSWRPSQDYTKGYGAKKSMGGGIILDDIHEIDSAAWLFDKVNKVFCSANKISNLKIETEDNAVIILETKKGYNVSIHMDYIQKEKVRTFKIIGEKGKIEGDIWKNSLKISKNNKKREIKKKFEWNQAFIDEIKDFIKCIKQKKKPKVGFEEAVYDLKIALAAKKSAKTREVIKI